MRNGRSCRCNWSQSPQDLRTPGRHWSLVSLSSLLPFPLKETAAPGAQEHLSQSRNLQLPADLCLLLLTAGDRVFSWCPPTWLPTIYSTHTLEVTGSVCEKVKGNIWFDLQPLHLIIKMLSTRHGCHRHFWKKDEEGFVTRLTSNPATPSLSRTEKEGAQGNRKIACSVCSLDTSSSSMQLTGQ